MGWKKKVTRALQSWSEASAAPRAPAPVEDAPWRGVAARLSELEREHERRATPCDCGGDLETLRDGLDALARDLAPERSRVAARLSELEAEAREGGRRVSDLVRELGALQYRVVRQAALQEAARVGARRALWLASAALAVALALLALEVLSATRSA